VIHYQTFNAVKNRKTLPVFTHFSSGERYGCP
jgi:hypothetical protein